MLIHWQGKTRKARRRVFRQKDKQMNRNKVYTVIAIGYHVCVYLQVEFAL